MAKTTKRYEAEFKQHVVRLVLEEGRTIASVNQEFQLGEGTVRGWIKQFQEECETNPELNTTKDLYEENRKLRKQLEELKKENLFLKNAAAFFAKELDQNNTNLQMNTNGSLVCDGSYIVCRFIQMPTIIIERIAKKDI